MSTWSQRAAMVPITRRVRAYFAPVNRQTETPAIFDPGKHGAFLLDAPPAPWLDLGWVDHFQRQCGTSVQVVTSSQKATIAAQFRGPLEARVDFDFREWGKLQMALASGSEHMNVLASDPSADAQPSGGTPLAAVAVLPGSTANEIVLGAGAVGAFDDGDILAVDADYQQQTGYVGAGIAAAYVNDPVDVNRDPNYVRRITFNLGRVGGENGYISVAGTAVAGRNAAGRSGRAKNCGFRGSRGRIVFSGMVRTLCIRRRIGREGLLFLSTAESDYSARDFFSRPRISARRGN